VAFFDLTDSRFLALAKFLVLLDSRFLVLATLLVLPGSHFEALATFLVLDFRFSALATLPDLPDFRF
jgi:hypothetical protein